VQPNPRVAVILGGFNRIDGGRCVVPTVATTAQGCARREVLVDHRRRRLRAA
jgi:hypothetical protein